MIDLSKLSEIAKSGVSQASIPGSPAEPAAEAPAKKSIPIQVPPGLPQEYIDANLQEQPVPQPLGEDVAQTQKKPLGHELTPGVATMCHRECIPYAPGQQGRLIQERIAQGPRVFVSLAQKEEFERGPDEEKEEGAPRPPALPQADTGRAGTYVKGESIPYRPGA